MNISIMLSKKKNTTSFGRHTIFVVKHLTPVLIYTIKNIHKTINKNYNYNKSIK